MMNKKVLSAGDWVEVRSKEDILKTLDGSGQLEGLPFMPQMFNYCGKRFRVFKRAHKTCDTVYPIRGRRMTSAVHLDLRCDGKAYGGCQAGCLIFWKDAWLKDVRGSDTAAASSSPQSASMSGATEETVSAGTRMPGDKDEMNPTYVCQATRLPEYTQPLNWWDLRQYFEDYSSGNVGLLRIARGTLYSGYFHLLNAGIGVGRSMLWFYDKFQRLIGGVPYPRKHGIIPAGQRTPHDVLNLQPGEWVRVKSYEQILATLDGNNKNRGLYFDAEAVPFCGGTYRVHSRVSRILDERTGKLIKMKTDSIILEGVYCEARYSNCRMFCPRGIYSYWREIWLERVNAPANSGVHHEPGSERCASETPQAAALAEPRT
jgi:hypothetical protein